MAALLPHFRNVSCMTLPAHVHLVDTIDLLNPLYSVIIMPDELNFCREPTFYCPLPNAVLAVLGFSSKLPVQPFLTFLRVGQSYKFRIIFVLGLSSLGLFRSVRRWRIFCRSSSHNLRLCSSSAERKDFCLSKRGLRSSENGDERFNLFGFLRFPCHSGNGYRMASGLSSCRRSGACGSMLGMRAECSLLLSLTPGPRLLSPSIKRIPAVSSV